MLKAIIAVFACAVAVVAHAQDTRAVEMLKQKGFVKCADRLARVTEFLHGKSTYAFLNVWNSAAPDTHAAATTTGRNYADGPGYAFITSVPVASGCDATFTQIFLADDTCTKVRETVFEKWKFFSDLAGGAVYEDPTTSNVNVILSPVKSGCLVVKTGILFFGEPKPEQPRSDSGQKM